MRVLRDLRYAARSLARTPGLTFVLLLTIGLGIGANAAVFGFIRGSVTKPLPLVDADSIVSLFERNTGGELGPISYDRFASLKEQHEWAASLGAARESQSSIAIGKRISIVAVAAVTQEVAELFGLPLADGVVISDRLRRSEFAGKGVVRGQSIRINGTEARIAAVAPEWLEGLYFGRAVDIWTAVEDTAIEGLNRTSRTFWPVGRLPPTISRGRAEAAANTNASVDEQVVVVPYTGMTPDVAGGIALIGKLLPAAAGAVFLIACANVAGFLLSRASARSHERSLRVALGATRSHLRSQLLAESMLVSFAGGSLAVLLAYWVAHIIPALLFAQDAERLAFAPDVVGIVAAAALCAGITVAAGLVPLFEIRHDDPASVLQRESAGPSPALRRLRAALVITQMTFCCVLVISTALLFESFQSALRTRAGHRVGQPVLVTVEAAGRFARPDLGLRYFGDVERTLLSLPGISAAAWTATPPGSRAPWYDLRVEQPHLPVREVIVDVVTFTPETAALVSEPLAGRMFGAADRPGSCRVAIVNREAAKELFGGDAVGRSIQDAAGTRAEIIGIVTTRTEANDRSSRRPTIYYYAEQAGSSTERAEAAVFRVPRIGQTTSAVLAGNTVSAGYFEAVGMSLTSGSLFTGHSTPAGCRIAVINREAAELYFGGNAVGGAVIDGAGNRTEIVGVVQASLLRSSQRRVEPAIYFPVGQDYRPLMTAVLSAPAAPETLLASIRQQLSGVGGGIPGSIVVTTLEEHLSRTAVASERIAAVLVGACAATALTLAVLGLYGALGDAVRHRNREIALRLALGAHRWRVTWQLLMEGVRLASVGTIAGMIGALAVARWLAVSSQGIGPINFWIWLAAPMVLFAAVALASLVPMRRAMTVNPVSLLQRN